MTNGKETKKDTKKTEKKKTTRPNQQKEENKYKSGDANKGKPVDLNAVNFKNKDVVKWDMSKKGGKRKVSKGRNISFGGRKLQGSGGTKMRLHRKKNNRSNA
jgi:hypothetical protein